MTTLSEVRKRNSLDGLTQLDPKALRLLWHLDFWDFPLTGIVLYEGRKHWFEIFDDLEPLPPRCLLIELTDEQLQEEEYWHALFQEKVGTHINYDEDGQPSPKSGGKLKEMHHEFYEPYQKRVKEDYSQNNVIGWFKHLSFSKSSAWQI